MSESDSTQLLEKVDAVWKSSLESIRSSVLLHILGYGLILFSLLEIIYVLTPPNFMNPVWEFQTFGAIVERIVVPLLGFFFIFVGGREGRFKWELPLLKGASWLALLLGILMFLAIPLGIVNTVRLDSRTRTLVDMQVQQGQTRIQQLQTQLKEVDTEAEMEDLMRRLGQTGVAPKIDAQQLDQIKKDLANTLAQGETSMGNQAKTMRQNQRFDLLKNSVKWNLGALISGVLFVWIWLLTDWSRRRSWQK